MIVETRLSDDFEIEFFQDQTRRTCMAIGTEGDLIYIYMTEDRCKTFIKEANKSLIEYQKQNTMRV